MAGLNIIKNPLSEMSLEELWQLFPIILREHNLDYCSWYSQEKDALLAVVGTQNIVRIHHIGSTAVPGMIAKPIIDILMEIEDNCDVNNLKSRLCAAGWLLMNDETKPDLKLAFNKGYTKEGFSDRVFHLHVRCAGDWDEPYFRDYLIDHPETAAKYGSLKEKLKEKYEHDRDAYTTAKSEFILHCSILAKREYHNKYATPVSN